MQLIVAEPGSAYARRPRLVVDANVIVATLFAESGAETGLAWMQGRKLCAPALIDFEVCNAAVDKVRRRLLDVETVAARLDRFAMLDLERHAVDPGGAMRLAIRYELSVYDASYLLLAEELQATLATFDARLGAAARIHLDDGSSLRFPH